MIGRVPSTYDDGSAIPADWNLRCASCGYSLTGLTSRNCPECGEPFSPRKTWEENRDGKDFPVSHWLGKVCFPIELVLGIGLVVLAFRENAAWVPVIILVLIEANLWFGDSDSLKMRLLGIGVALFGLAMLLFF